MFVGLWNTDIYHVIYMLFFCEMRNMLITSAMCGLKNITSHSLSHSLWFFTISVEIKQPYTYLLCFVVPSLKNKKKKKTSVLCFVLPIYYVLHYLIIIFITLYGSQFSLMGFFFLLILSFNFTPLLSTIFWIKQLFVCKWTEHTIQIYYYEKYLSIYGYNNRFFFFSVIVLMLTNNCTEQST